ncbi:MAG: 50S ribosome-binding GTPase [Candidatus Aenigmarchaeota archaeon]|nr:50S ribosome-binding GTPase [Candidatus Aenigmarchaeota archaeon]
MPINAGPTYFVAEKKFLEARTREEKIAALEEMIRTIPKHKGSEKQLALLRKRLANLRKQKSGRATARPKFIIRKTGSAQVCILGMTKSGKSSLLNVLTGVNVEVGDYPYTTKEPNVAMMNFGDVQIQLVEIPAMFDPESMSILYTCDEILVLLDGSEDVDRQEKEIKKMLSGMRLSNKKMLFVVNKSDLEESKSKYLQISAKVKIGLEELKERIWSGLGLIRVYTKPPGKPKIIPPITLPMRSTVRDVAENVHKDFLKDFKFARIFNNSRFSGSHVGLHLLIFHFHPLLFPSIPFFYI